MRIEQCAVPDVWVCTPTVHVDDRGMFVEWLRSDALAKASGRSFTVTQGNHSRSSLGAVRGIHFADVPSGQAKYVYCPDGAVLDVVVDVRVGSPTFGVVDTVVLDDVDRRAVFVAEGVGHAFCALREGSAVTYLVSAAYDPAVERAVSPLDTDLALPWPSAVSELALSAKDLAAPTLAEAARTGILPSYDACLALYESLR